MPKKNITKRVTARKSSTARAKVPKTHNRKRCKVVKVNLIKNARPLKRGLKAYNVTLECPKH